MNLSIAVGRLKKFPVRQGFVIATLILFGIVLRLRQFLTGRSLWADEAMLALNIVNRGFGGMFRPLDYDQGAPIGFLLVEKVFNSILGKNELVLRLFPLLVGLFSLWLFYSLLKQTTSGVGLIIALALFVFNPRLVYYSSEVKQYIVDVAVTISLVLIAVPFFNSSFPKRNLLWLMLAGVCALWFSHPAIFILAGIGIPLVITYLRRHDFSSLWAVLGIGVIWVINIGVLYFLALRDLGQNTYIREYWRGAFIPMPPWSDPGWFLTSMNETVHTQLGIPYAPSLVALLILIGWAVLFLQKREYAIIFACAVLVAVTASALQLYPILDRMGLFLVPLGLLMLGKASESLYRSLQKFPYFNTLLAVLLAVYLVSGPVMASYQSFSAPKYFEHVRPSMEYLHASWKKGDVLYISYGALPAFRFYAPFYQLEDVPYEFGRREDYETPQNLLKKFDSFQGKPRVWILLSHVYEKGNFNEKDFILAYVDQRGKKLREYRIPATSVYLYLYDLK
jgi:hypothetical protein